MVTLPLTPLASPLRVDEQGVVRIGATRVTLDTLVGNYRDGNTAEEIVQQYPALSLAEVHAAIAYYLTHRAEVEAYLQQRERDAADTRRQVEQVCDQRGIRERLLARQGSEADRNVIALLADEDFNARIIRGLLRRVPDLNLLTAGAAGLAGQADSSTVAWAAANGRVLLTHDVNTMIDAALERVRTGQPMPGVIAAAQRIGIGAAISDLVLIVTCAEPEELDGQVWYLPL